MVDRVDMVDPELAAVREKVEATMEKLRRIEADARLGEGESMAAGLTCPLCGRTVTWHSRTRSGRCETVGCLHWGADD